VSEILKQIGTRIKVIREISNLSAEEFAKSINLETAEYLKYETGIADIPISVLSTISGKYNIEITALLTGDGPHLQRIAVVKKDKGLRIDRRKEYKYQDLASKFMHKRAEVFLVTVDPLKNKSEHAYSHLGQEFNYILEGTLKLVFDGKEYILESGDSVYFDSKYNHAIFAVNDKPVKFVAVVL
jgi:mannose-6-phosphate isomerase-like protein (cupin superfamily)